MYMFLFCFCCLMAFAIVCVLVYAVNEIGHFAYSEHDDEEEEKKEFEHIMYWFWVVLIGIFIEVFLCIALYFIRKKINPCGYDDYVQAPANEEIEMSNLDRTSVAESEVSNRTEETSQARAPVVVRGALAAAYDPNRLDAIAERIRRAGENIDMRFQSGDLYVPIPTQEVERY